MSARFYGCPWAKVVADVSDDATLLLTVDEETAGSLECE